MDQGAKLGQLFTRCLDRVHVRGINGGGRGRKLVGDSSYDVLRLIAPHMALVPGFAIILTVLGLNLMGDGLRDYLDPRLRVVRT